MLPDSHLFLPQPHWKLRRPTWLGLLHKMGATDGGRLYPGVGIVGAYRLQNLVEVYYRGYKRLPYRGGWAADQPRYLWPEVTAATRITGLAFFHDPSDGPPVAAICFGAGIISLSEGLSPVLTQTELLISDVIAAALYESGWETDVPRSKRSATGFAYEELDGFPSTIRL